MLPKVHRLAKTKEIQEVLKRGGGIKRKELLFKVIARAQDSPSRFAVVVGRKVSKSAVVRNRIRRQIREVLRKELQVVPQGIHGVVIALPGADTMKFQAIREAVQRALENITQRNV